jgi:hypothetical protein
MQEKSEISGRCVTMMELASDRKQNMPLSPNVIRVIDDKKHV